MDFIVLISNLTTNWRSFSLFVILSAVSVKVTLGALWQLIMEFIAAIALSALRAHCDFEISTVIDYLYYLFCDKGNVTRDRCIVCIYTIYIFTLSNKRNLRNINLLQQCHTLMLKFSAEKLAMIRIGLTDVSPANVTPTSDNMRICACRDEYISSGETHTFPCGARGRYLVVLKEHKRGGLTLCEVQVYEGDITS